MWYAIGTACIISHLARAVKVQKKRCRYFPAPVLAYGSFINSVLDFLILAFVIFLMIRQINKLTPEPEPAPEPRLCPYCKSEIADDATRCPHCTSHLE